MAAVGTETDETRSWGKHAVRVKLQKESPTWLFVTVLTLLWLNKDGFQCMSLDIKVWCSHGAGFGCCFSERESSTIPKVCSGYNRLQIFYLHSIIFPWFLLVHCDRFLCTFWGDIREAWCPECLCPARSCCWRWRSTDIGQTWHSSGSGTSASFSAVSSKIVNVFVNLRDIWGMHNHCVTFPLKKKNTFGKVLRMDDHIWKWETHFTSVSTSSISAACNTTQNTYILAAHFLQSHTICPQEVISCTSQKRKPLTCSSCRSCTSSPFNRKSNPGNQYTNPQRNITIGHQVRFFTQRQTPIVSKSSVISKTESSFCNQFRNNSSVYTWILKLHPEQMSLTKFQAMSANMLNDGGRNLWVHTSRLSANLNQDLELHSAAESLLSSTSGWRASNAFF